MSVIVRRSVQTQAKAHAASAQGQILSRTEFASAFSADQSDLTAVEDFANTHELDVVQVSPERRTLVLAGTVAQMEAAFGVNLAIYRDANGTTIRGRTGTITIPANLTGIVEGVFGLDDRPQVQPHFRWGVAGIVADAVQTSFSPVDVAALYAFPPNTDGKGEVIALIELGGGYRKADVTAYFKELGLPAPRVVSVSVDKGRNKPTGSSNGPDAEVLLDIDVAGAVAPGAQIIVYFAPNTDQGFLDAITTAVHDTHHKVSVISISWGAPEKQWTQQAMTAFDNAFQDAGLLGVSVCCAAGDNGSTDGVTDDTLQHVDFPASSPNVIACGGTHLEGQSGKISLERVWGGADRGATGGGVSEIFPLPAWQKNANVPPSVNPSKFVGRGVPDIAGNADPATGFKIRVDGQDGVVGGTSAVAPLLAGLIARLNQSRGKPVGALNPIIYGGNVGSQAFHDVTTGTNGAFSAKAGWDPCTGWGSPNGVNLLKALP